MFHEVKHHCLGTFLKPRVNGVYWEENPLLPCILLASGMILVCGAHFLCSPLCGEDSQWARKGYNTDKIKANAPKEWSDTLKEWTYLVPMVTVNEREVHSMCEKELAEAEMELKKKKQVKDYRLILGKKIAAMRFEHPTKERVLSTRSILRWTHFELHPNSPRWKFSHSNWTF